ncbi:TPA: DUF1367 family protein [Yersinia enterocolitica]
MPEGYQFTEPKSTALAPTDKTDFAKFDKTTLDALWLFILYPIFNPP